MKRHLAIAALLLLSAIPAFSQVTDIDRKIDSLKFLGDDAFAPNSVYWRIVALGKRAIPKLISRITDTTQTNVSYACKTNKLRLGDVCYTALNEILSLPIAYITHQQFDDVTGNCLDGVYDYLEQKRSLVQQQIISFYTRYKGDVQFITYDSHYTNVAMQKNGIRGYYDVDSSVLKDN